MYFQINASLKLNYIKFYKFKNKFNTTLNFNKTLLHYNLKKKDYK